AVIVCKRGPRGCIVFPDRIPDALEDGLVAAGLDVEVYNVLGAGDAFLAGFLSGYLRDEPHEVSARLANACGALAVSRLLCSPAFPTRAELDHYLAYGSSHRALREDSRLNHLHWATTRRDIPKTLRVLAMEGRSELRQLALRRSIPVERLARLDALAVDAVARVAAGRGGFGVLLDGTHGATALRDAERAKLWLAQPVERPASRPLEFEAASLAAHLEPWPAALTVKCLCLYHPDDRAELRAAQERNLLRLAAACRALQRELLLEIAAGGHGELEESTTARVLSRLYELGIRPDWWALGSIVRKGARIDGTSAHRGAGAGPRDGGAVGRGGRRAPEAVRRSLGDIRARQRGRARRSAVRRPRRAADAAGSQRAGHGPRRCGLCQGFEPAPHDGVHDVDRTGRDEPRHGGGGGPRQSASGAAVARRRVCDPSSRSGPAAGRGLRRRPGYGERLPAAAVALLRPDHTPRAAGGRLQSSDADLDRPGHVRPRDARLVPGRAGRSVRVAAESLRGAGMDTTAPAAGPRGARAGRAG